MQPWVRRIKFKLLDWPVNDFERLGAPRSSPSRVMVRRFHGSSLSFVMNDIPLFCKNPERVSSSRTAENFEATCYLSLILIIFSGSKRRCRLCASKVSWYAAARTINSITWRLSNNTSRTMWLTAGSERDKRTWMAEHK